MLKIEIDNKAFVKTDSTLKVLAQELTHNVVTRIATFMERAAKKNIRESVYKSAPSKWYRRSGKSRQSIMRSPISNTSQRVFMGVKYGTYLENGTGIYNGRKPFWTTFGGQLEKPIKYKGMKARPFWKPAITETRKNVQRIMNEETIKLTK